jgi:hypothetical protein
MCRERLFWSGAGPPFAHFAMRPGGCRMTHGGAGRHKIDSKVRAKLKTNAWYRAALPVPSITRAMPQPWTYLSAGRAPVLLLVSAAHSQPRRWRRVATLLPIARRPTPFTDRIVLAMELAGPRAAEVALSLKVIDAGGGIHHTSLSPGAGLRAASLGQGESAKLCSPL